MGSRDPENPAEHSPPIPPPLPSAHFQRYRRLAEDDDLLLPRPSVLLPHLQENEKLFFELVHSGNFYVGKAFFLTTKQQVMWLLLVIS